MTDDDIKKTAAEAAQKAVIQAIANQATAKKAEKVSDNNKQAVIMAAAVSGQLTTAALGMIALEGAFISFAAVNRECGLFFWIWIALAFGTFVFSIMKGGKGTSVLYKAGAKGVWNHILAKRHYVCQTLLCILGLGFFIFAVIAARNLKKSESAAVQKELQTVFEVLTNQVPINRQVFSQLQSNQMSLDLRIQNNAQLIQSVVQALEKQSQVNREFFSELATNQQNGNLGMQLDSQQLQSVIQALEKQSLVSQQLSSMLTSNEQNAEVRSQLASRQLQSLLQSFETNKATYIKALFVSYKEYTKYATTNHP